MTVSSKLGWSREDHDKQNSVDSAQEKLSEIARLIRDLEGLPVDFRLARQLTEVLNGIEAGQ